MFLHVSDHKGQVTNWFKSTRFGRECLLVGTLSNGSSNTPLGSSNVRLGSSNTLLGSSNTRLEWRSSRIRLADSNGSNTKQQRLTPNPSFLRYYCASLRLNSQICPPLPPLRFPPQRFASSQKRKNRRSLAEPTVSFPFSATQRRHLIRFQSMKKDEVTIFYAALGFATPSAPPDSLGRTVGRLVGITGAATTGATGVTLRDLGFRSLWRMYPNDRYKALSFP